MSTIIIILYLVCFLAGGIIGIIIADRRYGKGDKMFGGHKHVWNYMYSNGTVNWFFCSDCLAECAQSANVDTGVVERQIFQAAKKKAN
jgi:hypothetical protein